MSARLIIFGLIALAFASLTAAMFYYKANAASAQAEAQQARANLAVAEDANKEAVRTIDALQEQARQDSRLTASLIEEMRKVNDSFAAQAAAQTELENTNGDVRAFLDTAVPTDLRKLHHH